MAAIKVGGYNNLTILRKTDIGLYLDDGHEGILLPKRFAPHNAKAGDEIKVLFTMIPTTGLLQPHKRLMPLWKILLR